MKKPKPEYKYQVNDSSQVIQFDTHNLFDKDYSESYLSAIDTFLEKIQGLSNLLGSHLIIDDSNAQRIPKIPEHLANLMVLAYVSAVESYFREIIRKIIIVDEAAQKVCEIHSLTYGAALIHSQDMLPEALLEGCSFASGENIISAIKTFIGFKNIKGEMPSEVKEVLEYFSKVCQLRHCIVHRFGRLGSKNMIELGLAKHKDFLEKPLKLDFNQLNDILLVCNNTVKVINNFLFQRIMARTVDDKVVHWHWDLRKDKKEFKKYYDIFASTVEPPVSDATLIDAYYEFKKVFKPSS